MFILVDLNPEDIGLRFRSLSAFLTSGSGRLVAAAESEAIGYGEELQREGHAVSYQTVAELLHEMEYSLQAWEWITTRPSLRVEHTPMLALDGWPQLFPSDAPADYRRFGRQ